MKRGFLNSKKAKGKPLYDSDAPTAVARPLKQLGDGAASASVSRNGLSEPVVASGLRVVAAGMPNPYFKLEPYEVFRVPSSKSTREPSSTCVLRQSTYTTIMNTPGFYTPLRPPLNPTETVFTQNTPRLGVGLFAKCNLKAHQEVFFERPLLVFPSGLSFYRSASEPQANIMHESMFDNELKQALRVMTKEEVDAYMGLSNCFLDSPQLYGIARTNAFETEIEEENPAEGKCGYAAVGKLASRINHSCMPNVHVSFDIPTFALRVIAVRNIKAGQQLFVSYCQLNQSVKERRKQLGPYGFICQCKACVDATPESDKLRKELEDRLQKIVDSADPRFGSRSLDPLLSLEKDIVKEGLDFGQKFLDLLYIIFHAYRKLNNLEKEMEYFSKLDKYTG